eukprot:TRINITY_DN99380_c0_g1_i1.p1 TRINITY_DN99380_c0_g1~~TRINITY_DN99380_c0_g1_i1.p1  ORF type:complete len:122 (-),score=32.29 TRINITY_DN99380_c0_g1_i1:18-383(-)
MDDMAGYGEDDEEMTDKFFNRTAKDVMGEEWTENLKKISKYLNQLGLQDVNKEAYAQVATAQLNVHLMQRSEYSLRDFILEDALDYVRTIPLELIKYVTLQDEEQYDQGQGDETLEQWHAS